MAHLSSVDLRINNIACSSSLGWDFIGLIVSSVLGFRLGEREVLGLRGQVILGFGYFWKGGHVLRMFAWLVSPCFYSPSQLVGGKCYSVGKIIIHYNYLLSGVLINSVLGRRVRGICGSVGLEPLLRDVSPHWLRVFTVDLDGIGFILVGGR